MAAPWANVDSVLKAGSTSDMLGLEMGKRRGGDAQMQHYARPIGLLLLVIVLASVTYAQELNGDLSVILPQSVKANSETAVIQIRVNNPSAEEYMGTIAVTIDGGGPMVPENKSVYDVFLPGGDGKLARFIAEGGGWKLMPLSESIVPSKTHVEVYDKKWAGNAEKTLSCPVVFTVPGRVRVYVRGTFAKKTPSGVIVHQNLPPDGISDEQGLPCEMYEISVLGADSKAMPHQEQEITKEQREQAVALKRELATLWNTITTPSEARTGNPSAVKADHYLEARGAEDNLPRELSNRPMDTNVDCSKVYSRKEYEQVLGKLHTVGLQLAENYKEAFADVFDPKLKIVRNYVECTIPEADELLELLKNQSCSETIITLIEKYPEEFVIFLRFRFCQILPLIIAPDEEEYWVPHIVYLVTNYIKRGSSGLYSGLDHGEPNCATQLMDNFIFDKSPPFRMYVAFQKSMREYVELNLNDLVVGMSDDPNRGIDKETVSACTEQFGRKLLQAYYE